MKKIDEYLKEIQQDEECCAAGIGFNIDSPMGGVLKKTYPKKKYFVATLPNDKKKKNKKRKILIDEQTNKNRHRVMIDFDGVVHKYDGNWNNGKMGESIKNIKESIDNIRNTYNNVDIIIFTTRVCKSEDHDCEDQIKKLKEFFKKNNIYYDNITGEKLGALIYIDDNSWRFSGDWNKDLPQIKKIIGERIEERENRR